MLSSLSLFLAFVPNLGLVTSVSKALLLYIFYTRLELLSLDYCGYDRLMRKISHVYLKLWRLSLDIRMSLAVYVTEKIMLFSHILLTVVDIAVAYGAAPEAGRLRRSSPRLCFNVGPSPYFLLQYWTLYPSLEGFLGFRELSSSSSLSLPADCYLRRRYGLLWCAGIWF